MGGGGGAGAQRNLKMKFLVVNIDMSYFRRASHIDFYYKKRHCDGWGWREEFGDMTFLNANIDN